MSNRKVAFIAHVREVDRKEQALSEHLQAVARLSGVFAGGLGLRRSGELIGLLHDLGKYGENFQAYLKSATGLLNPDIDEDFVDAKELKGRIDHSTAGAQLIWRELSQRGEMGLVVGQILALCIASHHSGLIDCLTSDPSNPIEDNFSRRMDKSEEKAHLEEAIANVDSEVIEWYRSILKDDELIQGLEQAIRSICRQAPGFGTKGFHSSRSTVAQFQIGLLVRLLFSCLIDADRINSADFEKSKGIELRNAGRYADWSELVKRLEFHLAGFSRASRIDQIRSDISDHCLKAASREKGIYTLTVPTGGGKTLASLRFALHHAKIHRLNRIVYVIPFTSIIDQNADVARRILEPSEYPEDRGRIVLEHHSNLAQERGWREKLLSENWDAPVVFTTSVQFLESLFGAGTRGARRMHQLSNAVIIFDEIQTLPVKCVHLFNNAANFLAEQCGSTIILCTATQPLLNSVDEDKGCLRLSTGSELMPDVRGLFEALKRVVVRDARRPEGWSEHQIADLAFEEAGKSGSCLVVVNTKKAARNLFKQVEARGTVPVRHLSTAMCPAHRREVLSSVRESLSNNNPVICVSTQLIEAGVDVDFGSVVRYAAGLDSIAQAAGRCNRNGKREKGVIHVINPADESLNRLEDIRIGLEKSERVLDDFRQEPERFGNDLLGKEAMDWYYENYFFGRKKDMAYPLKADQLGRDDTILNLLSLNSTAVGVYRGVRKVAPGNYLRQSFMAAARAFKVIDAPTQGVIVQYGAVGRALVAELCAISQLENQFGILRQAQQYTVNIFPNEFEKLMEQGMVREVQEGSGTFYLNERFYSKDFGVSTEVVSDEELLHV